MCIKIENLKAEHDTAAEADVFRTDDTAHKTLKRKLTPHTGYKLFYAVLSFYFVQTVDRLQV